MAGLIQCELTHGTMEDEYTCLSYVWGPEDPNSNQIILLNGLRFEVRRNLHDFFKWRNKSTQDGHFGLMPFGT